ncbi:MAG: DEAD/DEAH box helicase, partial [bacterium]
KIDIEHLLKQIRSDEDYEGQISDVRIFPAQRALYSEIHPPLPKILRNNLKTLGIGKLYVHQAEAVQHVRRRENVVIVTETASGKSLGYNLPVIETLFEDASARALYLFPTKALAQDQTRALHRLIDPPAEFDEKLGFYSLCLGDANITFGTYDGDTPEEMRSRLRRNARIIISNPDMLSLGILPHHAQLWSNFFHNLRYIVIDEIHIYRGIFGSHVANVLRRLNRICEYHRASPTVICCSATIANPGEHAGALTDRKTFVIDTSGAPSAKKHFVLWNPPIITDTGFQKRSPISETVNLFALLTTLGLRTIVFARAKPTVEVIIRFVWDRLKDRFKDIRRLIRPYRGGYLPSDRRQIERELATGKLLGVASTNALELGVDIGSLDAAIINGYPGTIASVWQQAGRAGRRSSDSIAVFVAYAEPLDQYFIRHPEYFFGQPVERAIINPENPYLLALHLRAAANELPLQRREEERFGSGFVPIVRKMINNGELVERRTGAVWAGKDFPSSRINLRTATAERCAIRTKDGDAMIGMMDAATVLQYLHDGAVYLHQGESYFVEKLDLKKRVAWVTKKNLPYYTYALSREDIRTEKPLKRKKLGAIEVTFGFVEVTEIVDSFKKIRHRDGTVIGREGLDYPPTVLSTHGVWFEVPSGIIERLKEAKRDVMGGLHAVEHAAIAMLPFLAMCDRQDIGGVSYGEYPETGKPTIFIHDAHRGGIGIAESAFVQMRGLLERTLELISECPCKGGCPSCIQSPKCGNMNEPLDKKAAVFILRRIINVYEAASKKSSSR